MTLIGSAEECVSALDMWPAVEEAITDELGVSTLEAHADLFVLFATEGAGGVDEPALRVAGGALEQLELQGGQRGEGLRVEAPAQIGAAAQRTELRARSVDEHRVDAQVGRRLRAVNEDAGRLRALGAAAQALE